MSSQLSASVVLYHSDLEALRQLLQSFQRSLAYLNHQAQQYQNDSYFCHFFVVDNSECPEYREQLKVLLGSFGAEDWLIRLDPQEKNLGYGAGHNAAIEQISSGADCGAEFHLMLNPDVTLNEDALCCSVAAMQQNNSWVLLSPKIHDNYEVTSHVVKRYPRLRVLAARYLKLGVCSRDLQEQYIYADRDDDLPFEVELAGGCYMFCRLSALQNVRGFDERYFLYFEDFDLCQRLSAQSGKIVYEPSVQILHSGGGVGAKHWRHHMYFAVSACRFFMSHGWKV